MSPEIHQTISAIGSAIASESRLTTCGSRSRSVRESPLRSSVTLTFSSMSRMPLMTGPRISTSV